MKIKNEKGQGEPKKFSISILLNVVAIFVALLGVALLANNIYLFKSMVDQYVMQGYPANEVMKSLVPGQLLPAIFENIALYGGIAFALVGIAAANKKISKCIANLNPVAEVVNDTVTIIDNVETANEEGENAEGDDVELKQL